MVASSAENPKIVAIRYGNKRIDTPVHDGEVLLPKLFTLRAPTGPARRAARSRKAATTIKSVTPSADYAADAVTRRVIGALGNNTVAALLEVSNDRPSRWASGAESPSAENRALLADLDSLVGQLLTVFSPGQAVLWLDGQDSFLSARPLDVYRLEGAAPLIEAMKAYEQGAFA